MSFCYAIVSSCLRKELILMMFSFFMERSRMMLSWKRSYSVSLPCRRLSLSAWLRLRNDISFFKASNYLSFS